MILFAVTIVQVLGMSFLENQKAERCKKDKITAKPKSRKKGPSNLSIKQIDDDICRQKCQLKIAEKLVFDGSQELKLATENSFAKNLNSKTFKASGKFEVGLNRKVEAENKISILLGKKQTLVGKQSIEEKKNSC
jgi:hypothetical protein